ncbi:hypothetical protein GJ496_010921 [Pomphorhynchus laevis]|nr:hypothetical protein GJ496_010921 [Pomphorhynchus laevis]
MSQKCALEQKIASNFIVVGLDLTGNADNIEIYVMSATEIPTDIQIVDCINHRTNPLLISKSHPKALFAEFFGDDFESTLHMATFFFFEKGVNSAQGFWKKI